MPQFNNEFSTRSGIFTCASEAIAMRLSAFGEYEYCVSRELSEDEESRVRQLDGLRLADEDRLSSSLFAATEGISYDGIIGYYLDLYCGHASSGEYREHGTSGGLTTWLLCRLLELGHIDGVICVGPSEAPGVLYEYQVVCTEEEIQARAKSRYYPMELSKVLKFVKDTPGRYAIVGIPSFASDVRRLQAIDEVFAKRLCFVFALLCGHQKTTKYGEAIALEAGMDPSSLEGIDFRYKIPTGVASDYVTELTSKQSGSFVTKLRHPNETFVNDWGAGMFKSTFSDYIDDCFGETADATFGDAWLPQYAKDGRGTNVVVIRNQLVSSIFKEAQYRDWVALDAVDVDTVHRSQRGMIFHYRTALQYRLKKLQNRELVSVRHRENVEIPFLRRRVQDLRLQIAKRSKLYYREAEAIADWRAFNERMRPLIWKYRSAYWLLQVKALGLKGAARRVREKLWPR